MFSFEFREILKSNYFIGRVKATAPEDDFFH